MMDFGVLESAAEWPNLFFVSFVNVENKLYFQLWYREHTDR